MKWEYKIVKLEDIPEFKDTVKLQEELDKYGEDGWELVDFAYPPYVNNGWVPKDVTDSVIFKRQVVVN